MAKKQNPLLAVLAVSSLCLFPSCLLYKPTGYNTITQNVPLLSEKHEVQLMATYGANHIEEQIAFAPTEHLAVLGNFWNYIGETTKGYCVEGGIGYHKNFANNGVIEAYGIFTNAYNHAHVNDDNGSGSDFDFRYYIHDLSAHYNGYSLQFDIGKKLPNSEMGISLRYGLIEYSNFYYHLKTESYLNSTLSDSTYHLENKEHQFLTVAPTFKFGWTNFKFLFQLSYHLDLTGTEVTNPQNSPPFYSPILLSIALVGDLFFQKKKEGNK